MHNAVFEKLGINAAYVPLSPEPSELGLAIQGFRAMKFLGANVTIPFKEKVGTFLDGVSEISRFTGSVNTLYWENGIVGGRLLGTTTDPYGALCDLEEHGIHLKGLRVAILGNGGAARAIAFAMLSEGIAGLTIVARSKERGAELADALSSAFPQKAVGHILFGEFGKIREDVDLVLNATSEAWFRTRGFLRWRKKCFPPASQCAISFIIRKKLDFCGKRKRRVAKQSEAVPCWCIRARKVSNSGFRGKRPT